MDAAIDSPYWIAVAARRDCAQCKFNSLTPTALTRVGETSGKKNGCKRTDDWLHRRVKKTGHSCVQW